MQNNTEFTDSEMAVINEACAALEIDEKQAAMVSLLAKKPDSILKDLQANVYKVHLNHMAVGIAKEAGELLDAISRLVHYGNGLDDFFKKENKTFRELIVEELGDIEFYLQGMREAIGVTRVSVLLNNQRKLMDPEAGRYKEGKFSDKAANERVDKKTEKPVLSIADQPVKPVKVNPDSVGSEGHD